MRSITLTIALLLALALLPATLQFSVGWFSERMSREVLDSTILKDMGELGISLDLDFYSPDADDAVPSADHGPT